MIHVDKPKVLMCVHLDFVYRDLVEGGILERLANEFELTFLTGGGIDGRALQRYGRVLGQHAADRIRLYLWDCLATLQSIRLWRPIVGGMARDYFTRKRLDKYSPSLQGVVAIERLGLARPVGAFASLLLDLWVGRAVRATAFDRFDLVIAPSVMRDFIADDLVRWARKNHTPSLLLQMNLDNFNIKVPTVKADQVAVWGDQSWYIARLVHRYPRQDIYVTGSPRLDSYADLKIEVSEARRELGLPASGPVLLFCGATAVFDESDALAEIDLAIADGRLPRDCTVLYKPHPKGMAKGSGAPFDPGTMRHVRLYPGPAGGTWNPLREYATLFSAVDAVITPFSTMGVEAGIAGLPVLCLGYHRQRTNYWRFAEFVHLKVYYDNSWSLVCTEPERLIPQVKALVGRIGDERVVAEAQRVTRSVVYRDVLPYADRLIAVMHRMLSPTSRKNAASVEVVSEHVLQTRGAGE